MSDPRRVVYVDRGAVGAAMEGARADDSIELVEAQSGADAIKLLRTASAAAVVLPEEPRGASLRDLVDRITETEPGVAVLVVGGLVELPEGVRVIPADASPETAYDRLRAAIGSRRLDDALSRHARLATDALTVAEAAATAEDRAAIERAVYDWLVDAPGYRFVWVVRPDGGDGELAVGQPFPGQFSAESVADAVGAASAEFLTEAVETGAVTVRRGAGAARSPAPAAEGATAVGGVAAVPFAHAGRTHAVAVLGVDDLGTFDAAERALLGRVGRIVGHALDARTEPAPEPPGDLDRIDEFVDFFVHEVRNPLSIALAYLDLARTEDDDEALDRVEAALETIDRIVDAAASIGASGGLDEVVEVPLASIAGDVEREVDAPDAELRVVGSPAVAADPELLERVLSNLYRNAVQHGREDVTVRVGALADAPGFFVEDDGPGIPEAEREQIFEWGYSTGEEGLGVGLGFVKRAADAHGWHVAVGEASEGGLRFEFYTESAPEAGEAAESGLDALFDAWESGSDDGSFVYSGSV